MPQELNHVNNKIENKKINATSGTARIFLMEDQEAYGLRPAILLYRIKYFITENSRSTMNYKNGKWWTYDTMEEIAERLEWPVRTVKDCIKRLLEKKAIEIGKFGVPGSEKTNLCNQVNWYTLHDSVYPWPNDEHSESTKDIKCPLHRAKNVHSKGHKMSNAPYTKKTTKKTEREGADLGPSGQFKKEEPQILDRSAQEPLSLKKTAAIINLKDVESIIGEWNKYAGKERDQFREAKVNIMDYKQQSQLMDIVNDTGISIERIITAIRNLAHQKRIKKTWKGNKISFRDFIAIKSDKKTYEFEEYLEENYNPSKYGGISLEEMDEAYNQIKDIKMGGEANDTEQLINLINSGHADGHVPSEILKEGDYYFLKNIKE